MVTGGSRGIGRAICLRLAAEGANIVLHYNSNETAAESVAREIGRDVTRVRANIRSIAEIEEMFQRLHGVRLNFLINNAGVWKRSPLGSSSPELVEESIILCRRSYHMRVVSGGD
jgi:3-oxoacyl-[acyl-carrier protein] reductase